MIDLVGQKFCNGCKKCKADFFIYDQATWVEANNRNYWYLINS